MVGTNQYSAERQNYMEQREMLVHYMTKIIPYFTIVCIEIMFHIVH